MRIIKLLTFLNFILLFTSCNKQVKSIDEEPLDLLNFNFNTKIESIIPKKYESKYYKDYYTIPRKYFQISFQKESTFIDEFGADPIELGTKYLQKASSNMDTLAVFKNQTFNRVNFATNLNNEIFVVSAVADETSETQSKDFLKTLTEKYGKYKKTEGDFGGKFFIYEWENNNQIIKYSTVFNDEINTLKIAASDNQITSINKEPHMEGYFYIIKKENIENIKNLNTGDFVFIDE